MICNVTNGADKAMMMCVMPRGSSPGMVGA